MLKNSNLGLRASSDAQIILSACIHAKELAEGELPQAGFLSTERGAVSKWFPNNDTTSLALSCLSKMRRENRVADMQQVLRRAEQFSGFGDEELNRFWKEQAQAEGVYQVIRQDEQLPQVHLPTECVPAEAAG